MIVKRNSIVKVCLFTKSAIPQYDFYHPDKENLLKHTHLYQTIQGSKLCLIKDMFHNCPL